jgi:RNA polymerase sigma factor (sigma-70 family)
MRFSLRLAAPAFLTGLVTTKTFVTFLCLAAQANRHFTLGHPSSIVSGVETPIAYPLDRSCNKDMSQTPPSLLDRLREHPEDTEAWNRFDTLYRPLLSSWLRRHALQSHDADDLLQEVLQVVLRELPKFHFDPSKGRFRGWLRAILVNRLREFWRSQKARPDSDFYTRILDQLEDPRSDLSRLWDQEHDEHVGRRVLALIDRDFLPSTLQAFHRVMAGEKASAVAAELKMSVNAVYLAKSSVLKRLRQELHGLLD